MSNFMPFNNEKARVLDEKLGQTIFGNAKTFVKYYNSGQINRNNEEISDYASEITETYRDVKLVNKRLVFVSKQEVYLKEINDTINLWNVLLPVKEELVLLLQDKVINPDTTIVFTEDNVGYVSSFDQEGNIHKVGDNKVFNSLNTFVPVYEKYSSTKNPDNVKKGLYIFRAKDLLNLDDSFLGKVHEIMPK